MARMRGGVWTGALLLGALAFLAAIVLAGTPAGHSRDFNLAWFVQFDTQFWSGILYPRRLPGLWFGLGGLDFFFYGPLPFWVASVLGNAVCPGCAASMTFAAGGAWLLALSGLSFYVLAARLFERRAAIIASVVYVLLPYHLLVNWFIRQSVGEVCAYIFIPLLAYGFMAILEQSRKAPIFSFALAGLILAHLPTALLAGHVFAIAFLVWAWSARHDRARLAQGLAGLILWGFVGLGLAAFYWLPALVLVRDVSPEALYGSYFEPTNWLYLTPGAQPLKGLFRLILICLFGGAAVILAALYRGSSGSRWVNLLIAVPFLTAAFLMTGLSRPIWEHWLIARVQFPWRLMSFVDFSTAVAVGALVATPLRSTRDRAITAAAFLLLLAGFAAASPTAFNTGARGYRSIRNEIPPIGAAEYLPPDFFRRVQEAQGNEGLPVWAVREVGARLAAEAGRAAEGTRVLADTSRRLTVTAEASGPELNVALPYWRHFVARSLSQDTAVSLRPDPMTGMTIVSPWQPGEKVEISLPLHWSEKAGYALGLSALPLLALALRYRRRALPAG